MLETSGYRCLNRCQIISQNRHALREVYSSPPELDGAVTVIEVGTDGDAVGPVLVAGPTEVDVTDILDTGTPKMASTKEATDTCTVG